jgi:hypothetical protein
MGLRGWKSAGSPLPFSAGVPANISQGTAIGIREDQLLPKKMIQTRVVEKFDRREPVPDRTSTLSDISNQHIQ